jgi:hypothetical protein
MLTTKSKPLVTKLAALADDLAEEAFGGMAVEKRDAMRAALGQIRDNVAVKSPRGKAFGQ